MFIPSPKSCSTVAERILYFHVFLLAFYCLIITPQCDALDEYTLDWAVEINEGPDEANRVAQELGFQNLGLIGSLKNKYHFRKRGNHVRVRRSLHQHTQSLVKHAKVKWAEQQRVLNRIKRDFMFEDEDWWGESDPDIGHPPRSPEDLQSTDAEVNAKLDNNAGSVFNDPNWQDQWYLHDTRTDRNTKKLDLHIIPVWKQNITGRGVVVSILDDGLEKDHPDIVDNYDAEASIDLNDDDDDPQPRYDSKKTNKHGTRCAGEVSMIANNGLCGVGVAFNAKIGGIRILDGKVTDLVEAKALTHALQHIDIFSASWGPSDDGKTMEGPGPLAKEAFEKGIKEGRGGKGVIYVWASGNGGAHQDDCECDGYTSSIYTLSISSATQQRTAPWYSERCASTMATTYSSGRREDQKVVSIDLNNTCTTKHSGTSASAPMAAGIFALSLEKNPNLSWRDMQHLVAWTSEYAPVMDNEGWRQNGGGFYVNTRFGFGLLNAAALVEEAARWTTVPPKVTCESRVECGPPEKLRSGAQVILTLDSDGCHGTPDAISYLEHVQIFLNISYTRRGDLEISLVSPSSVETPLLKKRENDESKEGILEWPFMSVHSWGENPVGNWQIKIQDRTGNFNTGEIHSVSLMLHGTRDLPEHVKKAKNHRRTYNDDYNAVKNLRSLPSKSAGKFTAESSTGFW